MNKILMCEPVGFDVSYVINPWMRVGEVDKSLAQKQWQGLYDHMKNFVEIKLVDTSHPSIMSVPDIVFTANAAFLHNGVAYPSYFAHPERRAETEIYTQTLENLGYKVNNVFVDQKIHFEGAGDALLSSDSKTLYLAWGHRSDKDCWKHFLDTNLEIIVLKLNNPHFYHLDTCFCPLTDGYALVYLDAFDDDSQKLLKKKLGRKLIAVGVEDANTFACNAVEYEPYEIVLNQASSQLKAQMSRLGFYIYETPLTEYLKSGGAAKCLTLRV